MGMEEKETVSEVPVPKILKGIHGWLIFPAFALVITPIRMVYQFIKDMMPAFAPETWNALTNPESPVYHPLWGLVIGFEVVSNLLIFIFTLWLIRLFFKKSNRVPTLIITWMLGLAVLQIADYLFSSQIPAVAARQANSGAMRDIGRLVLSSAVWIPYFILSKRVKNTFIEPVTY
jgi:hypothetical protein